MSSSSSSSGADNDTPFWMDGDDFDFGGGGGDDEDKGKFYRATQRDGIVALIDCSPSMFETPVQGEKSAFVQAVSAVRLLMEDKIISSDNDLVSVVLYGTDKANNSNSFPGVYVLHDLDVITAERINKMRELEDANAFQNEGYGHCDGPFEFHYALWMASSLFSTCTHKPGTKRVWLFTDNDNPNGDNAQLKRQASQRAKDLSELDIDLQPFFMQTRQGQTFDAGHFYADVVTLPEGVDASEILNVTGTQHIKDLQNRIRMREYKKRTLGVLPLNIGGKLGMGIKLYNLMQSATKRSHVWLSQKDNERVKIQTRELCAETGATLTRDDFVYYYPYGGMDVRFTKDELNSIKNFGSPGLELMGFKDRSALKLKYNLRHAYFAYPAEDVVQGSTVAFHALHAKMLSLDKLAVCRMIRSKSSQPVFAALVPQAEEKDEDGVQVEPAGFWVVQLPYNDDVRKLDIKRHHGKPAATQEQIVYAKRMIKTLSRPFDSNDFENPGLQMFYASLQAMALNQPVQELEDLTLPDHEYMSTKAADDIKHFAVSTMGDDAWVDGGMVTGSKRSRDAASSSSSSSSRSGGDAKRQRTAGSGDDGDLPDWRAMAASGTLKKLKVAELKDILAAEGIKAPSKAKKQDLIDLLEEASTRK